MKKNLRKGLVSSTVVALLVGFGMLFSPRAVERLYAEQIPVCRCYANCLLTDCSCVGLKFCKCDCFIFRAFCDCKS